MTNDGWSHYSAIIVVIVKIATIVVTELDIPVIVIISTSLPFYRIL